MTEEAKRVVPKELIDSLLAGFKKPEDLIGENGLLNQLTKLLVEKALDAEMTEHLGHDKNHPIQNSFGNARNGKSKKTLKGDFGELAFPRFSRHVRMLTMNRRELHETNEIYSRVQNRGCQTSYRKRSFSCRCC